MASRFAKVSEEENGNSIFYPSDLVNTKTTIPLRNRGQRDQRSFTEKIERKKILSCVNPSLLVLFTRKLGISVTALTHEGFCKAAGSLTQG